MAGGARAVQPVPVVVGVLKQGTCNGDRDFVSLFCAYVDVVMVGVLVDVHVGHLVAGVAAQGPVAGLSGPRSQLPVRRGAAGEAALMVRGARERGRGARARPVPRPPPQARTRGRGLGQAATVQVRPHARLQ